jgi:hypothetical protein
VQCRLKNSDLLNFISTKTGKFKHNYPRAWVFENLLKKGSSKTTLALAGTS